MSVSSGLKGQKLGPTDVFQTVFERISAAGAVVELRPEGVFAKGGGSTGRPDLILGEVDRLQGVKSSPDALALIMGPAAGRDRDPREPVVDGPSALDEWLDAWIERRVFWDDGEDFRKTRVCLVTVPVLCRECGMEFRAALYLVARFAEVRPWLKDRAIWVGSGLFRQAIFHSVNKLIATASGRDGRKIGRVVEPANFGTILPPWWTNARRREWTGPSGWSVCPGCGAPAPGYEKRGNDPCLTLSAEQASMAPLQDVNCTASCEGLLGWSYPAWRIRHLTEKRKCYGDVAWRNLVRKIAGPVWTESKRVLRMRAMAADHRAAERRAVAAREVDFAKRRVGIVRTAALSLFGPLYEDREAIVDAWMHVRLEEWSFQGSPREIAERSADGCRWLRVKLEEIAKILDEGGESGRRALRAQIEKDPAQGLGLPILDILAKRNRT